MPSTNCFKKIEWEGVRRQERPDSYTSPTPSVRDRWGAHMPGSAGEVLFRGRA